MKKTLYLAVVLLVILAISGCVTVKKVVRERVDQDLTGNRGVIQGRVPEEPSVTRKKDREYIDIRVEIPTLKELEGRFLKAKEEEGIPPAEAESSIEPAEVDAPAPIEEEESKYIK